MWDTASWCARNSCEKRYYLFLLGVSDCKRSETSLNFIFTNFYTKLKPEVKVSHDMNVTLTRYTTFDWSWTIGKPYCFDQVWLKSEVGQVPLSRFVDLYWRICLTYTSKAWLTWKCLMQSFWNWEGAISLIAPLAPRLWPQQVSETFELSCLSVMPVTGIARLEHKIVTTCNTLVMQFFKTCLEQKRIRNAVRILMLVNKYRLFCFSLQTTSCCWNAFWRESFSCFNTEMPLRSLKSKPKA